MPTPQLDEFDKKAAFVLYYENEEDANRSLLDPDLLEHLKRERRFSHQNLRAMLRHNGPEHVERWKDMDYDELYDHMVNNHVFENCGGHLRTGSRRLRDAGNVHPRCSTSTPTEP